MDFFFEINYISKYKKIENNVKIIVVNIQLKLACTDIMLIIYLKKDPIK